MASTVVYRCDWCGEIVPKRRFGQLIEGGDPEGEPQFAMQVTVHDRYLGVDTDRYDICVKCRDAFRAVSRGKYKR